MRTEFKDAKDIFFYFGGNKYFMARQDMIDEYNKYNISNETEKEWLEEIYKNRVRNMDINNFISITNVIDSLTHIYTKYIDTINFIKENHKKSISKNNVNKAIDFLENSLSEDFEKNMRFHNGDKKNTFFDLKSKLKDLKEELNQ